MAMTLLSLYYELVQSVLESNPTIIETISDEPVHTRLSLESEMMVDGKL